MTTVASPTHADTADAKASNGSEVLRALKGERDRAVYELQKVRGELRRALQQLDLLKDEHKGCASKQKDSQRTLEGVEAEYQKLRAADTAKALEGATTVLEQRQTIANLNRRLAEVEQKLHESELSRCEAERKLQAILAQGSVRQQLEAERATIVTLQKKQVADKEVMAQQAARIVALEGQLATAQSLVHELEGRHAVAVESHSQQTQQLHKKLAARHAHYRGLLREGQQAAIEAQRALELSLREHPTLFRSGTAGLLAWLESYHLDPLHSCLINSGFTDLMALMHITEEDLVALKQTVGTRRKVLGATAMLKRQFEGAPTGTEGASTPLAALQNWLRDFEAIVDAEEPTFK